jgi:hypothetical protein
MEPLTGKPLRRQALSYNHTTTGWEKYDRFLRWLRKNDTVYVQEDLEPENGITLTRGADISERYQDLRRLRHWIPDSGSGQLVEYIVEEYLSVDDGESDGHSEVDIVTYRAGKRPRMFRYVYDGGQLLYPEIPVFDFIYSISDGTWIEMSSRWEDDEFVE